MKSSLSISDNLSAIKLPELTHFGGIFHGFTNPDVNGENYNFPRSLYLGRRHVFFAFIFFYREKGTFYFANLLFVEGNCFNFFSLSFISEWKGCLMLLVVVCRGRGDEGGADDREDGHAERREFRGGRGQHNPRGGPEGDRIPHRVGVCLQLHQR
ncbi:hypothetical protein TNCT_434161 [Trichonephila clavata]|uniref:Uncharacterized protein n=1 Tax=Trichonephila clavata TaxID=2740835 RepID=A0A8X6KF78_TRICU|nr:hypothetical protein TNCT_434161 [Trichonephila clavata]